MTLQNQGDRKMQKIIQMRRRSERCSVYSTIFQTCKGCNRVVLVHKIKLERDRALRNGIDVYTGPTTAEKRKPQFPSSERKISEGTGLLVQRRLNPCFEYPFHSSVDR